MHALQKVDCNFNKATPLILLTVMFQKINDYAVYSLVCGKSMQWIPCVLRGCRQMEKLVKLQQKAVFIDGESFFL